MTILLTQSVRVGGGVIASGTTQTLAADLEADLVQRKMATYISNPADALSDVLVRAKVNHLTGGISVYGQVVVPGLVAGETSSASANTKAIQTALNTGGNVFVGEPGTIYVNDTLICYSNTQVSLGQKTIIKQVSGTNKVLLTTDSQFQAASSVSLAWTSGTQVTVTWAAHGKTVGDYVWLLGASEARYRGVFRVDSVVDADNFKVNTAVSPTAAPSGTITAKAATTNVIVEGGTWDYNYPANNGSALNAFAMSFYGCADVSVRDVSFETSAKYSLCFCAFMNAEAKRIVSNTQSDCIKVYGPGNVFSLDGISGSSGDDILSVQAQEGTPYAAYQIQTGDLYQIVAKNINGKQSGTTSNVNIYLSDNCILYGLDVAGVGGAGMANLAIAIQKSVGETTGFAEEIKLSNISTSGTNAVYWASGYVANITIDGVQANPHLTTSNPVINFTGGASAGVINIQNSNFKKAAWSSATAYAITLTGAADVVNIRNSNFKTSGAGTVVGVNVNTGCSVKVINLDGNSHGSGNFVYIGGVPTVVPQINLRGNDMGGVNPIFIAGNANISLSAGNRITNASNGVLRFNNTFTVTLAEDGSTQLVAGSWLTVVAGTPVLTAKGFNISLDIGATGVAKTNGAYCFNNGAARGTVNQNRLVTCNGTNWVQVDTPANVF